MKKLLLISKLAICSMIVSIVGLGQASALSSLENFYASVNTLRAEFRQTVFDADQQIIDQSRGALYIARPGRFRWEYAMPLPQNIISDAEKIWVHDIELEQVTVRNYQQTLAGTPAELLAGTGNIREQYEISSVQSNDDYEWLLLQPKIDDTQFVDIRIGFKDGKLTTMRLTDSFERTTQLIFDELQENAPINLSLFTFELPEGVDVIDNTENF